ncbi:hypothetical protein [Streptomyces nanshensis]|uniref:hypothetical protein n=1 Tax=Streptomyces nanshensis TaxID=518642 RepID=UPI00114D0897|nr:hypothetical protein [Streptomyces nanshensis]
MTGAVGQPADWERTRIEHAVSLALEAGGVPPADVAPSGRCLVSGYQVSAGPAPHSARVVWKQRPEDRSADGGGPGLDECQRVLYEACWASERYLGSRHRPYLLVWARGDPAPLL